MTGLHRRRKRTTTTDSYAAMLARMLRAYGSRIGTDPAAGLAHMRDLETAMTDAINLGIYEANKVGGHSINELAAILGMSKQAVHKRVGLGEQLARQRAKPKTPVGAAPRVAPVKELPPGSTGG
jgi:hypothetical protein